MALQDAIEAVLPRSAASIAAVAALAIVSAVFFYPKHDPLEPPVLQSRVPYIGHLIGMINNGAAFLSTLERPAKDYMSSLPVLNGQVYAVWDPSFVQSVQLSKDVSFNPFVKQFMKKHVNYSAHSHKVMQESPLVESAHGVIAANLTPKHTHQMNVAALRHLVKQLDAGTAAGPLLVDNAWCWIRDLLTVATMDALYGRENPLARHPYLLEDIWTVDKQADAMMIVPFANIFCRKGWQARKRIQKALAEFYDPGHFENDDVPAIVRARVKLLTDNGIEKPDIPVIEWAFLSVATINTIPTAYWAFINMYSTPGLRKELREEGDAAFSLNEDGVMVVNLAHLADRCPLLASAYRESIRLSNHVVGTRQVMKDTNIRSRGAKDLGSYLLKADTVIQYSGAVMHRSTEAWGPDAAEFKAHRFMDPEVVSVSRKGSFIPFGGGKHLCPGRNFAQAENLGLLYMLLVGYEVMPSEGTWESTYIPKMDSPMMTSTTPRPVKDGQGLGLRVVRRPGWENVKWEFTSVGSS